jgi:hypothetical protein
MRLSQTCQTGITDKPFSGPFQQRRTDVAIGREEDKFG